MDNKLSKIINRIAVRIKRLIFRQQLKGKNKALDNLRTVLAEDPIIRVEEFNGNFYVDKRSDLFKRIVIKKHYEPKLVKLCKQYIVEKRDVIDIGANIGFYTVLFAKIINNKKVLAIEPTSNTICRLRKNIKLNNVTEKVEVFEGVVSDKNGSSEIKTINGKEEYSSLGSMQHPSINNERWNLEKVRSCTLDTLVKEKKLDPGFLKIDVEGAENMVFNGAANVLANKRPIILSELSDYLLKQNGSTAKEVINLLESYDYEVYDPMSRSKQLVQDFGEILCIPKEMDMKLKL